MHLAALKTYASIRLIKKLRANLISIFRLPDARYYDHSLTSIVVSEFI